MPTRLPARRVALPLPLQQRSNDEFTPPPYSARDRQVIARVRAEAPEHARRVGVHLGAYWADRLGTAGALRALDAAWGGGFYDVPPEAVEDRAAADAALGGDQLIIDVQTHFVAAHRVDTPAAANVLGFIRGAAAERWGDLPSMAGYGLARYLRCIYLESETAVAVLTTAPGEDARTFLANSEIAGTRELVDRLAGTGRLINHAIVHPNRPDELERMVRLRDRYRPAAWKVYTLHGEPDWPDRGRGWMLDDEAFGRPFLARSRELGVGMVCAHKGLSGLVPTGSPADIGPAAAAFPDLNFVVYHSGYERAQNDAGEGPYSEEVAHLGTNRLVRSLKEAGIGPGGNVYAELGSTWFLLIRRPREAAHVLGKLLLALGEDNIVWGTDCIWYDSPQPLIDAFRAFQIPEALRERHGYPALTPAAKEKILGLNAARLYGIEVDRARAAARTDDLTWVRAALAEEQRIADAAES